MDREKKGAFLIVAAMLIFASYGVFIRWIPASPVTLLFFNQVFGALAMLVVVVKKKQLAVKGIAKAILLLTIVAVANDYFYFNAFRLTTLANSVLTHYTAPIFVAIFAPFLIKEKVTRNTATALALSFAGLILILYSAGFTLDTNMTGVLLGTASGLMYGLMIIAYKHSLRTLSVYTVNFYRYLISIIILSPLIYFEAPAITVGVLPVLFGFAILFAVIATTMHTTGINLVKAQHAGIIGYVEPLAAVIYGVAIFSEVPSVFTAAGGALIIAGSYIVLRDQAKNQPS